MHRGQKNPNYDMGDNSISKKLADMIEEGVSFTSNSIMEQAESLAEELRRKKVDKNKLRGYFEQIKNLTIELSRRGIEQKDLEQIRVKMQKMRARLTYDSARDNLRGVKVLIPVIKAVVERVKKVEKDQAAFKKELQGFCDFMECVVGYHYAKPSK